MLNFDLSRHNTDIALESVVIQALGALVVHKAVGAIGNITFDTGILVEVEAI